MLVHKGVAKRVFLSKSSKSCHAHVTSILSLKIKLGLRHVMIMRIYML